MPKFDNYFKGNVLFFYWGHYKTAAMLKTYLSILLVFSFFANTLAQQKKFVRIFDLSGNKMGQGFVGKTTDSSLLLKKDSGFIEYSVMNIGFLKTKRSGGHTMLISGAIGAATLGILGATVIGTDEFFDTSAGEAFALGFLEGGAAGVLIGGIVSSANKREMYQINGDLKKWDATRLLLDK